MTVKLIKTFNTKVIKNKKGNLLKYISRKDRFYNGFGEIYFNEIKKNNKKGWTSHRKNNCLIKCLVGKVRFHFIDKKERELKKILNSNQNKLLKIPPNIWFCFESLAKKSLVVNLIERPHEDKEVNRSSKIKNYLIK